MKVIKKIMMPVCLTPIKSKDFFGTIEVKISLKWWYKIYLFTKLILKYYGNGSNI